MLLLSFVFHACKKNVNSTAPIVLPTVDSFVSGTLLFKDAPQFFVKNRDSVKVHRSCPCYPSHEVYFFEANIKSITDTINTTYTWTVRMAVTYTFTGKKIAISFPLKGNWNVELEAKTNGTVVYTETIPVFPFGNRVYNLNVSLRADCIDANKKYFVSLYSTHNAPLDGYVNSIYWDLGDGTILKDTNYLQHYYPIIPKDTTYLVKLFINNSNGCKDSAFLNVFVPATYTKVATYAYSATNQCKPYSETFTFIADTVGFPKDAIYEWDFKDYVKYYRGKIVTHQFTHPNRYDVNLRVWHNGRMISSYMDSVRAKGQYVTSYCLLL